MATYQEQMIGIVGQDPGIPISLAVFRFLQMQGRKTTQVKMIDDSSRRFGYAVVMSAIKDGEITKVKEGPSVRLYLASQETRS